MGHIHFLTGTSDAVIEIGEANHSRFYLLEIGGAISFAACSDIFYLPDDVCQFACNQKLAAK